MKDNFIVNNVIIYCDSETWPYYVICFILQVYSLFICQNTHQSSTSMSSLKTAPFLLLAV